MPSGLILSEGKSVPTTSSVRVLAMPKKTNVGGDRQNSGIRILPLLSANGLLGRRMSGQRSGQLLFIRMGDYPLKRMNHEQANGMKKETGILPKGLEILHQERRGQMKTIIMEHFNGILFHKSGPANKQHTNQPTTNIANIAGINFAICL